MAGTPGACSQVFCHPIRCMLVRSYRQRHVRNSPVRTTTTTQAFDSGVAFLCSPKLNISGQPMAERAGSDVGSARRRRERRLRSWWRHERMTVAAELAVALHHSRGVGPAAPHEALRGQSPASPGGRRPGVLKEPKPPVVVEHAACPCSGAPLLVVPSLAAAESDGVDGTSLKYLLKVSLRQRQKEEEEEVMEKKKEKEQAAETRRRAQALVDHAASLPKRKTKKKRKRKLPHSSSHSSLGRARRRQRQWHACGAGSPGFVPLRAVFPSVSGRLVMLGIMAGMDQKGLLQVRYPFRAAEADPHGPDYSADHRVFPVAVRFRWSMPCCADRACHAAFVSTTAVCAQGWSCWFRCASAVFLLVVAGQDLRHLGRYGPKGQLQWYVQGWCCW